MDRNLPDYTPEFRAEAVKLVLRQGLSLGTAATRLSLPKATLRKLGIQSQGVTGRRRSGRAFGSGIGSRSETIA